MATVQKRGNSYKITASCGYDSTGKQIRPSTTWAPAPGMTPKQIEKELERQKVMFEEKCKTGVFLDQTIKFSEFADRWFADYAEKQLKAKTVSRYRELMKRITPAIGHIRLDKLQPHHLMAFYDNLGEGGICVQVTYKSTPKFISYVKGKTVVSLSKITGVSESIIRGLKKGKAVSEITGMKLIDGLKLKDKVLEKVTESKSLSPKTVLHHHRLISSILTTAVQWQVIFSNPCERVKPPKVERKEAKYLDEVQAAELLGYLDNEHIQHRTMIMLLLYTGMRRGELCGLEWPDIDFANKIIHIQRASLYLPDKGIFEDTTKNYTSERVIKVADEVIKLLAAYRINQNTDRLKLWDKWVDSGKVFVQQNGRPIHPDTVTGWFSKFIKRNNLPEVSIHSLRHTNATLLIASGTDLRTVSKRLGHANMTTTGNIYTHAIKSADEMAADTLQDILKPMQNNKQAK